MPSSSISPLTVLGLAGSLRAGSYNRALLRAAQELCPPGLAVVLYELDGVPFYDGDVEAAGDPEPVICLKRAIVAADALLIATPEYNGGLPAVIKNAVDWASRPRGDAALAGKPVAVIGTSAGQGGAVNAQAQLRATLDRAGAVPVAAASLAVPGARTKFHDAGLPVLTDEPTRSDLRGVLDQLHALLAPQLRKRAPNRTPDHLPAQPLIAAGV